MRSKHIQEVKEEWEKTFMKIPGVTGVGIGLRKGSKEKCIQVFVQKGFSVKPDEIPATIEGFPVEIIIRGPFHPL